MAPGDSINCGEDTGWFSSWTMPGCEEPDSIVTQIIENNMIEPWVEDARRGVADSTKTMLTFWIDIPDPVVQNDAGAPAEVISFLQNELLWLGAVVMCFIMAYQVGRMMWEMNVAPAKMIATMVLTYLATAILALPIVAVGLLVTNYISQTILEKSTEGTSFADNFFSLFDNMAGVTSGILIFILLLIGMIIACFQILLVIGRGAALFVILGMIVFGAAASGTQTGQQAFKTQCGWMTGLLLYKVVAAAIYGVGFRFLGTDTAAADSGLMQILYGITLLAMAVFSLPAIMRLTSPAVTSSAGEGGIGQTIAGAAPIAVMAGIRR